MKKIKAKKLHMTQLWKNDRVVPITWLKIENNNGKIEIKEGEKINVSGVTKGKGFQGVVKRHGFRGGPKTHGQKNRLRAPGSIGPTAPQRVIKGRKMAGHMGNKRLTIKNLLVAEVKSTEKLVAVRGAVPGTKGTSLEIRKTI